MIKDTLMQLTTPMGVSGNEDEVRSCIEGMKPSIYTSTVDHIGNLIWSNAPVGVKYLFTAHMDEIGLMVSGYDKTRLKISAVGGIDPRTLPNTQWVCDKGTRGVIGLPAPHITKNRDKVIAIDDLRMDVGIDNPKELQEAFPTGTVFVSDNQPFTTGDNFFSRNTDNRAGCAALVELANLLSDVEGVSFAFLVREEIGLMRARAHINANLNAEYIINLDVCVKEGLGKGAVISLKDGGYMADKGMVESFRELGAKNFEVGGGGTSDHAVGQLFAKTCGVSFPSLYIHSGVSKVNIRDIEDAVNLCKWFVNVKENK